MNDNIPENLSSLTSTHIKKFKVVAISELIEEEVTLLIDQATVTCFAGYYPCKINVGSFYQVELTLSLAEHYNIQKLIQPYLHAERKNDGFSYELRGSLNNYFFETFTSFNHGRGGIHHDPPELNGDFIMLTAEIIDAAFL